MLCFIVSPKSGDTMDHARSSSTSVSAEVSCVQPTTTFLLGFLLNFASGLFWQRSGQPFVLVAQESKLCSGELKTSKILTIALVQAIGHSFFPIYFIFSA